MCFFTSIDLYVQHKKYFLNFLKCTHFECFTVIEYIPELQNVHRIYIQIL